MYSCMPKKVQNQKMTKKNVLYCDYTRKWYIYVLLVHMMSSMCGERISTIAEIGILLVPDIYLCGNYCKSGTSVWSSALESIILFQIVVHCPLIVHDIPKAQYLQIPTDEYIPPCRISRTALRKIFLGHISCTRWGNKHFQGGMCVLCLFSLCRDYLCLAL